MAINLELKKNLENNTRRLGTRADSYLDNFFIFYCENSSTKTLEQYFQNSEKIYNSSSATKKQIEEVFLIFKIINIDGDIILPNVQQKEVFKEYITTNIKSTIKSKLNFKSKYKNNIKLINNIVYSYGVNFLEDRGIDVREFSDDSMIKRTSELKSNNIIIDDDFINIVINDLKLILDQCGLSNWKKQKLETENINLPKKDFKEYKEKDLASKTENIFDLINIIINEKNKVEIPFYQREYVWTEELMENFIKDISSNKNDALNIGNILISIKNPFADIRKYILIDGQQRLTSMMIIVIKKNRRKKKNNNKIKNNN